MNYTGQKVYHKSKYGYGVIVEQEKDGHIKVRFDDVSGLKSFSAPECFSGFLKLLDESVSEKAVVEVSAHKIKMDAEKIKKANERRQRAYEQIAQYKEESTKGMKKASIPCYSTTDAFFDDQERLIVSEISYLRQNGGKRQKITDGELVERKNGIFIYSFESDSELNLPDNTSISLWVMGSEISGTVLNCEEFTLIIATSSFLGDHVPVMEFSADPWMLLRFLTERLRTMRGNISPIVSSLILEGIHQIRADAPILTGQENALRLSLRNQITFIWGPPGTGKTETLANIAIKHMRNGCRVLVLSYSNVSVDGAVMRTFQKTPAISPGHMLRYGYPRNKELIQHDYLTSYNYVLSRHPELVQERSRLIEERKHTPRTFSRYVEAGNRLTQIKKQVESEEKDAVREARFVATTVSKAVADAVLYEDRFDTVIFDEASMAYIPQIVFSAGLATKHFICMGDFAQLPPIVQSSDSSALNADIFQYCGITEAVEAGHGHAWLCMLDKQYRMHPDIADFASRNMYSGLLKTASWVKSDRKLIAASRPAQGKAVAMYDLSGMLSVCMKTADNSRINVFSAMISMAAAVKAAEQYDVGIVSPYSAQARLLHAMSRDLAENHSELHKIACATVHQFQGSERDIIIYDAVDCYRATHPGMLLTSTANNYANRLYNVAMTRARGKFISVVNADYMRRKKLSENLVFRKLIDQLQESAFRGSTVISSARNEIIQIAEGNELNRTFIDDLYSAKNEIRVDLPGPLMGGGAFMDFFTKAMIRQKRNGIKIHIRVSSKEDQPIKIRDLAIENHYFANPITMIDKRIVWYGMPHAKVDFIAEGTTIPTIHRPAIRFEGRHFAQALYGFLEMNRTVDQGAPETMKNRWGRYDTFRAYVTGELRCPECQSPLCMQKGKTGKFFISCTAYPECKHTEFITKEMIMDYFYKDSKDGKLCPHDKTSLEPCVGKYGLYIRCNNGLQRHIFKLDEV